MCRFVFFTCNYFLSMHNTFGLDYLMHWVKQKLSLIYKVMCDVTASYANITFCTGLHVHRDRKKNCYYNILKIPKIRIWIISLFKENIVVSMLGESPYMYHLQLIWLWFCTPWFLSSKVDTKSLITRTVYIIYGHIRLDCVQRNYNKHSIMHISYMHSETAVRDKFLKFPIKYSNTNYPRGN